jgi:hypothetical protein
LSTAAFTIEAYCRRRLLGKKRFESLPFYGEYGFPLREYPVREVPAVYQTHALKETSIDEPDLYHPIGGCGDIEDMPCCLWLSPALGLVRGLSGLNVQYRSGYGRGEVPPDLASACVELTAWNMSRYRGAYRDDRKSPGKREGWGTSG